MTEAKKILIVEDEFVIALDLASSLERAGYIICGHITKGEEVLTAIVNSKPDLILMDVKLDGDIDGVDTAQIVRDNFDIPVIFLTSYSNKKIIDRAKKVNPFGYIIKPFEDKELLTNIEIAFFKHETELKLKDSEKKYRELSESIQQIVFECDKDGLINYINEPGMQMLGITPYEKKTGLKLADFFSTENFNQVIERINSGINFTSLNVNREYLLKNRLSKHIYVEEFVSPIYMNGTISGYRGILVDVTSKKLKSSLQALYNKLTLVFNNANDKPEAILKYILYELKYIFLHIDEIYFKQFDHTNQQVIIHYSDPLKPKKIIQGITKSMVQFKPLHLFGPLLDHHNEVHNGGDPKVSCWCGFPILYEDVTLGVFALQSHNNDLALTATDFENLTDFFSSAQSLLERLSYLKMIKRSEKKYKYLVNSITEGIVQLDFHNNVTYVNSQLCKITGQFAADLIGKNVFEAFNFVPENKLIIQNKLLNNKEGFKSQYPMQVTTTEGIAKDLLINTSPLINDKGRFIGALATVNDVSENKAQVRLVNESEQKFKAIFQQAAVGVAIINSMTGEILEVNQKYCGILGYTAEELRTKTFKELTYKEDVYVDIERMADLLAGKIVDFTIEKRKVQKNGDLVWVSLTVSPLWKPGEKPTSHIAILENISKRKIVEDALIVSEEEKEDILKAMPDSFIVVNRDGIVTNTYLKNNHLFLNKHAGGNINGLDCKTAFVGTLCYLIHENLFYFQEGDDVVVKQFELHEGKTVNWFEIRFVRIKHHHLLVVIRDVTSNTKNINEIKKFYNIIEQTKELIMITDKKGLIEYINPMFTEVTGYSSAEVIGKLPSVLKSNKHNKVFFAELWDTILAGQPFKVELTNSKKNGELYIEEKIITPLINSEGEITNFISTGRDITEDKKRAKKILTYQKFEKTLEKKEQKYRTLSLIQGQENERKRIARELHDGLGQMLTVAVANLDKLKGNNLSTKENKNKIHIASEMISEIIQESRRISYNLSPGGLYEFGLNAIITQFANSINRSYENIKISYESNLKSARFKNDVEINLYRIIQETIQNSLKHSKCTTIKICIHYDGELLKLGMSDNGIGFNLKHLENGSRHFNGIKNIQERARIIDSKLSFLTSKGNGCNIDLTLKLKHTNYDKNISG